jgi:hypothetical protein
LVFEIGCSARTLCGRLASIEDVVVAAVEVAESAVDYKGKHALDGTL